MEIKLKKIVDNLRTATDLAWDTGTCVRQAHPNLSVDFSDAMDELG